MCPLTSSGRCPECGLDYTCHLWGPIVLAKNMALCYLLLGISTGTSLLATRLVVWTYVHNPVDQNLWNSTVWISISSVIVNTILLLTSFLFADKLLVLSSLRVKVVFGSIVCLTTFQIFLLLFAFER